MNFSLGDDGTMDTVIVCDGCGAEMRFNFDGQHDEECITRTEPHAECDRACYDAFIESCIEDCEQDHECESDIESEDK